jgi:hypothetical protein
MFLGSRARPILLCPPTTVSHRNLSNLLAECTETGNDEVLHPSPLSATKFEEKNRLEIETLKEGRGN